MKEKNLDLERLIFFSDAVVAIAITLLVIDLKIEKELGEHLTFEDLGSIWPRYVGFAVSFMQIGSYWQVHHQFFHHIKKADDRLMGFNFGWLAFIVLLPFTTSLISSHLTDRAAILAYAANIFAITIFQNAIWDYAADQPGFLSEATDKATDYSFRVACNLSMLIGLLAVILSFFLPIVAFVVLFFRPPLQVASNLYFRLQQARDMQQQHPGLIAKMRRGPKAGRQSRQPNSASKRPGADTSSE